MSGDDQQVRIIEDSSNVPYTYKGSHDTYLKYGASAPKLDPAVLVPYLAQATTHLGIVPASTPAICRSSLISFRKCRCGESVGACDRRP